MGALSEFSINTFRTQLLGDGARPNRFSISLHFPDLISDAEASRALTFTATAASLPQSTIGVARQHFFGREAKFAGDRVFPPWTITVINDEDFVVRNAFERWSNLMNNYTTNVREPLALHPRTYCADAKVYQYSKNGVPIKAYKFIGMFPTNIDPIRLDWQANDRIEEFNVTLEYQFWETDDSVNATSALSKIGSIFGAVKTLSD